MRFYLLLCLLLTAPIAFSDTLTMADTQQAAIEMPTRGLDMTTVETTWGMPLEKRPPVGDPPITRWVYADFIVYFEYDKVLHSVLITQQP